MEYSKGKRNRRKWAVRLEEARWVAKAGPVTIRQGQLEEPPAAPPQPAEAR
jgi:hypothetical protein